jgi:hypothetical protein
MKNIQNENINKRIFTNLYYQADELEYEYSYIRYDSTLSSSGVTRINNSDQTLRKKETRETYRGKLGYSFSKAGEKADFHIAALVLGSWKSADRDEGYDYEEIEKMIYPDSTCIESESESGTIDFEVNEYRFEAQLPVGITYHINDKIDLLGGIGFAVSGEKSEFYEESIFSWDLEVNKSIGISCKPVDCCQIDLNFSGTLTSYNSWLINIKYLW